MACAVQCSEGHYELVVSIDSQSFTHYDNSRSSLAPVWLRFTWFACVYAQLAQHRRRPSIQAQSHQSYREPSQSAVNYVRFGHPSHDSCAWHCKAEFYIRIGSPQVLASSISKHFRQFDRIPLNGCNHGTRAMCVFNCIHQCVICLFAHTHTLHKLGLPSLENLDELHYGLSSWWLLQLKRCWFGDFEPLEKQQRLAWERIVLWFVLWRWPRNIVTSVRTSLDMVGDLGNVERQRPRTIEQFWPLCDLAFLFKLNLCCCTNLNVVMVQENKDRPPLPSPNPLPNGMGSRG